MKAKLVLLCVFLCAIVPLYAQLPSPTYGWNLGNTLEPPCGEGCWGSAATQNLINAVASAGFNTIRIPCAWDSNANQSTYVIDSTYMARVKEVVDWCYGANLYVIVNCHWDNGWLEKNIGDTVDSTIAAKQYAYWTQISETFINYDDKLMFAGCNEPDIDTAAQMATLLVYEQTFVDAVRDTGGNNSNRWLIVQGPKTDINLTYQLMNTLPTDTAVDRMMVEVHYYDPYQYTLMTSDASWGDMFYFWGQNYYHDTMTNRNADWGREDWVNTQFEKMKTKFVDQGIPVIIGEFCAFKRTGYSDLTDEDFDLHVAGRTYFHKTIMDVANAKGLKPIFWDIQGQNFNWTSGTQTDPDNITVLTGGAAIPPPGADITPPNSPTEISVELRGVSVFLDWGDNSETDLSGYYVYRSTTSGSGYTALNSTVITDSQYTDNTGEGDQTYYYIVTAVDTSSNESDDSDQISATIPNTALGTILYERWIGISGTAVDSLTSNSDFPDHPFIVSQLDTLEGVTDSMDEYGSRISGYLYPPTTGDYTFWIAGDDNCQLWLSTDGTPDNAELIAEVPGWTDSRQWDKYTTQQSDTITLTAGRKYYIDILHKEGTGGDNLAVAWSGPGISRAVIDGAFLSPVLTDDYGDFDGSGSVTFDDIEVLAEDWLLDDCILTSDYDLNGDCIMNLIEFAEFAAFYLN